MITSKTIKNCADGFERLDPSQLDEPTLVEIRKSNVAKFVVIDERDNVRIDVDGAMLFSNPVENIGVSTFLGRYEKTYVFLQSVQNLNGFTYQQYHKLVLDCITPQSQIISLASAVARFINTTVFCSKCATKLEYKNHFQNTKICAKCGTEFYPKQSPAVMMMVSFQDKLLVGRRRTNLFTHMCGFIEPGETGEQACYRELLEESGIPSSQIASIIYLGVTQPWVSQYVSLMLPFHIVLKSQFECQQTPEIDEFKWIDESQYIEAGKRADAEETKDWVVRTQYTIARLIMQDFFRHLE